MITKNLKISYSASKTRIEKRNKLNPKITLTGDWLKNAGFEIGNNIQVTIKNNQLIIKNLTP